MNIERITIEAEKGLALIPEQIVAALSRPGVIGYEVTTTGVLHPHIKKLELEIDRDLVIEESLQDTKEER